MPMSYPSGTASRDFWNQLTLVAQKAQGVCDTRNYLTHYDETTTGNRATGSDEMFELYGKLDLFQLC